jgi:hypothetical protein
MHVQPFSRFLAPFFLALILSACEIINPTEDTPSYLKINNIVLDPSKSSTESYGTASNNIVDAWVFANGKLIGTFELPATIPILAKDSVKLNILAGVYGDGQKGARFPYGFYTQYNKTVFLEPAKVTEVKPVVKFNSSVVFPFDIYEDFTNFSGIAAIRPVANSTYQLEANRDTLADFPYANGVVGVVYAGANGNSQNQGSIKLESIFNEKLPQTNQAVFLEFDYRSTMDFKAGVILSVAGQTVTITDLTVNKTRNWTKMYLNLTEETNITNTNGAKFRMVWEAFRSRDAAGQLSNPNDYFAIDNIRLIHKP